MDKLIFCNLDLLKSKLDLEDYEEADYSGYDENLIKAIRDDFKDMLLKLAKEDENEIIFYSRKVDVLNSARKHYEGEKAFKFAKRKNVEDFVKQNSDKNNNFVFVGAKNQDFIAAVQARALFIVPCWLPLEDRTVKYGVHVENPLQFYKFIRVLNNQNVWYSKVKIDEKAIAYSLIDARYGWYAKNDDEREMVKNFENLLKNDMSHKYHRILLYHFLAGMTNTMDFDDIEIFGMIPSSNCKLNQYVYEFMTHVRNLKGVGLPKQYDKKGTEIEFRNLIIRHTPKVQNHAGGRSAAERASMGAGEEFKTLMVNPDYKKRIDKLRAENRFNVCIFDDYMTHGNSFNAVRNMLENLGANKIIFVSMGLFKKDCFQRRDYHITGDVYRGHFQYEEVRYKRVTDFEIDETAKDEVAELRGIFALEE